jgi:hypothetical protein
MTIAFTPLVIAILGLLLWLFAKNTKLAEAGKYMFIIGTIGFVLAQGGTHMASFQLKGT